MNLESFASIVDGFDSLGPTEKIRGLAWHLHRHQGIERFGTTELSDCFTRLNLHRPANIAQLVNQLAGKDFIRDARGLRASKPLLDKYDKLYGQRSQSIEVHRLLEELPQKLTDLKEADYLEEALKCLRAHAFRAALIMTWNVAYDHLLAVIIGKYLAAFNSALGLPHVLGGKRHAIASRDDFQKWKEFDVIEVCKHASILSKEVGKVFNEKLEKRNSAAHPSGSTFDQVAVEAYISELIKNGLLKL